MLFQRITIKEIRSHLSNEEILKIVEEAKVPAPGSRSIEGFGWGGEEDGDAKEEEVKEDEDEYEKRVMETDASGEIKLT
ncbi:hypothetical protein SLEP1_g31204 [Rubroshorea leprosula]|uniref:Uncharacterized protein n=1 Tax=Rubroshorea leprosula TaxID=152421 RepID=A0AAV5K7N0_9ROSI|nr:hypothetical protein SLEP1_g31204 [Rubroshorea leprosula]